MKLFFDLDGTLIDSRDRLYNLFNYLVPENNLTFDEYWSLKRERVGHEEILINKFQFDEHRLMKFQNEWMKLIEDSCWLRLDEPFSGVKEMLIQIKNIGIEIFILTARQSKVRAVSQIESFGWSSLIDGVLVTERKKSKAEMLNEVGFSEGNAFIIGDTGEDIIAGKENKIGTVAVLSGFIGEKYLINLQPDIILNYVTELNLSELIND